ncbi:MAG: alpha/beta hydrolase [Chloroflexota bacterium]
MNKRKWLITTIMIVFILGYVGYDLSLVQAGLEEPSEAVLATAAANTLTDSPPLPISTYEHFSVPVEGKITVAVHMREAQNAAANILMVHGAGGGAWVWEEYFELLPETYNLYAISWRGHFISAPVADANSADYVRDQTAVITAIAERNDLPIHVIGHSYGGATSVLATAAAPEQVASLHLLAPVVPLNYTSIQKQLVPLIMTPILSNQSVQELAVAEETTVSGADTQGSGTYAGMFLNQAQMERYWDLHAAKPYSVEKPSLIGGDGLDPAWQTTLDEAYTAIGAAKIPVWFQIARYDNVVIPAEQRETADAMGAAHIELESGHYIQLDVAAEESAKVITKNLASLNP